MKLMVPLKHAGTVITPLIPLFELVKVVVGSQEIRKGLGEKNPFLIAIGLGYLVSKP